MQLLVDIGAIRDSSALCLNEYLLELETNHKDAQKYLRTNPFATARRLLQMHEQRLTAIIKAVKNVLNPPRQHGSFVNNLPDTNMEGTGVDEPDDNATSGVAESGNDDSSNDDDGEQSPSHGDSNPSPTPHIEYSNIQYVQLPLPKNQGWNDLNQDRQSGGRGGNHR